MVKALFSVTSLGISSFPIGNISSQKLVVLLEYVRQHLFEENQDGTGNNCSRMEVGPQVFEKTQKTADQSQHARP
jgi:hypothetical protein